MAGSRNFDYFEKQDKLNELYIALHDHIIPLPEEIRTTLVSKLQNYKEKKTYHDRVFPAQIQKDYAEIFSFCQQHSATQFIFDDYLTLPVEKPVEKPKTSSHQEILKNIGASETKADSALQIVKNIYAKRRSLSIEELKKEAPKLIAAAEKDVEAARIIFTSSLCQAIPADGRFQIYAAHADNRNQEFKNLVMSNIHPHASLVYLVSKIPLLHGMVTNPRFPYLKSIYEAQKKKFMPKSQEPDSLQFFEDHSKVGQIIDPKLADDIVHLARNKINPYEFLGLELKDDADKLKAQYRKKALELHPDRAIDKILAENKDMEREDAQVIAEDNFKILKQCFNVLSDEKSRELINKYIAFLPKEKTPEEEPSVHRGAGLGSGPIG